MKLVRMIVCVAGLMTFLLSGVAEAQVRAAWVTAWEKGFLTPAEADATIAAAKRAHIDTLFIQVRKVADAYYDSSLEPRASNIAPGYDPLAYVIEKAHKEGIKVHAWVNVCRVWKDKVMPVDPSHLVNRHPEWINRDASGNSRGAEGVYIDPGVPEARQYVVSVIKEIVAGYDVDGIHLDYIRYPGKDWGYTSGSLKRYSEQTGRTARPAAADPAWSKWRRDQVTRFVNEIRGAVKSARPKAQLSAATICWRDYSSVFSRNASYNLVFQDWGLWMSSGLIDLNVPMNYRNDATSSGMTQFRAWMKGFRAWGGSTPTYVGIDIYHNEVGGVARQIQAVQKSGLAGFSLFSFNDVAKREPLVAALAKSAPPKRVSSASGVTRP